jgi:hypothetical protein
MSLILESDRLGCKAELLGALADQVEHLFHATWIGAHAPDDELLRLEVRV